MKKYEIAIITLILALAGVFLMVNYMRSGVSAGSSLTADMYVEGKLYKSIPITEEETIEVDTKYGKNAVKVHDGGVEMIDADCPDKLCKGFGFKTKLGDQIVCLPHHLYIEVR